MLDRLLIKNFQKHAKLDLRLEAINVFVGDSDTGKSAVIRALRWLVTNKPGGNDFVKHGETTCHVRLKVEKNTIVRERGKENVYAINGEELKAFGASPPDSVSALLNMDPLINFQGQHDSSFWFSESPGDVGRRLNAIVNLEVIDRVLTDINAKTKQSKAKQSVLADQKTTAEARAQALSFVPELVEEHDDLESCESRLVRLREAVAFLNDLVRELSSYQAVVSSGKSLCNDFAKIRECEKHLRESRDRGKILSRVVSQYRELRKVAKIRVPDTSTLDARYDQLRKSERRRFKLEEAIEDFAVHEARTASLLSDLKSAEQQLLSFVDEVCPTCGQLIKS